MNKITTFALAALLLSPLAPQHAANATANNFFEFAWPMVVDNSGMAVMVDSRGVQTRGPACI